MTQTTELYETWPEIHLSGRSIAYTAGESQRLGLDIEFVESNCLDYRPEGVFDLVTLIFCDLCRLSPRQRRMLLTAFRDLLSDDGSLLLDVSTLRAFDGRKEVTTHEHRLLDGFRDTFKYDEGKVAQDKYTIVVAQKV